MNINMPKIKIPDNVSRTFHKTLFKVKKHSPEILLATGIIGGVTSAVMACKATTKIDFVLEEAQDKLAVIDEGFERGTVKAQNSDGKVEYAEYTAEDHKKDRAIVHIQTGLKIAKLYAPSIMLGVGSIGCVLMSNNIMRKRNAALAVAYAAEHLGFDEYRSRVIERFGEELDKELTYNIKAKEIEETVVNEDGTEQVVKKTVNVAEGPISSPYTLCFDETCLNWVRNAEDNKFFLMQVQNWANERLKSKGMLFLNEVLDALGAKHTQAGQIVGWVYDEEHPNGDNYVDFGIYNIHSEASRNFVNGYEKSIWLEFNVDGNIQKLLS